LAVDLQDLSRRLFATANQLWTNTELRPDQYAQPVLALIALRQMEARFDVVDAELPRGGRLGNPTPPDYHAKGAIFLPPHARFSYLLGLPETENLAEALNEAMKAIAEHNPDLAGVLPQGYGSLPNSVLRELLRLLQPLAIAGDAYGLIFECSRSTRVTESWPEIRGESSRSRAAARLAFETCIAAADSIMGHAALSNRSEMWDGASAQR
jgi:type I restriction enzyme M protein